MFIILAATMVMENASVFELRKIDDPVPRRAHQSPVKGDIRAKAPKGYVWLKPVVEIDGSMVSDAKIEGQFVRVDLNDVGRVSLSRLSREWNSKSVAALINHKIVYTSPFFSPIDQGKFLISGNFDNVQAAQMVKAIRAAAHLSADPAPALPPP